MPSFVIKKTFSFHFIQWCIINIDIGYRITDRIKTALKICLFKNNLFYSLSSLEYITCHITLQIILVWLLTIPFFLLSYKPQIDPIFDPLASFLWHLWGRTVIQIIFSGLSNVRLHPVLSGSQLDEFGAKLLRNFMDGLYSV